MVASAESSPIQQYSRRYLLLATAIVIAAIITYVGSSGGAGVDSRASAICRMSHVEAVTIPIVAAIDVAVAVADHQIILR